MAQDVTFNISFVDKFSRVGKKLKGTVDKTTKSMKKFTGESGKMARGLKKIQKAAGGAAGGMKSFGKKMSLAATLPIAGFAAMSISAAASAEEMESKLGAAFGGNADDIRKWSESFGESANRGTNDLRQMAADAGALMGNMFEGPELANTSKKMVQMAEDLGSFFDTTSEVAFQKIASGLAGSFEPLRQFGVMTNKAEIDQKAMQMAGVRNVGQLTEGMRATALLAIVQEKQSAAMGDAVRTSESFTNQMKGLKGALKDVNVKIGQELIPMVLPLVRGFAKWVKQMKDVNPKMLKVGIIIAGVIAVLGPLLVMLGFMATAVAAISWPVIAVIVGIAAFIAVLVLLWKYSKQIGEAFIWVFKHMTPLGWMFTAIGKAVGFLADRFAPIRDMIDGFKQELNDFVASPAGKIAGWFGFGAESSETSETNINIKVEGEVKGADTETSWWSWGKSDNGRAMEGTSK